MNTAVVNGRKLHFRHSTREEFNLAIQWATAEGWNPGLDDADIFWNTDPKGFVCIESEKEVIGSGSIVSYQNFGFMGFFIVRPDLRQQGYGSPFWLWRRDQLMQRLHPGAAIGMDGVINMQPFYARGGFVATHKTLRMESIAKPWTIHPSIVPVNQIPFDQVQLMDVECFGFDRTTFLKAWINPKNGCALAAMKGDLLAGYGVIRKCLEGHKIGPLFAGDPATANSLFEALSSRVNGEKVYLDIPENNLAAIALAKQNEMTEVFACGRMYLGNTPKLPWQKIYGITTFELG